VGVPYWYLATRVISPKIKEALHTDNWPLELELAHFEVCASRIQFDSWALGVQPREREYARIHKDPEVHWGHSNCAWGKIVIDLVNKSKHQLKEGRFTVSTGAWVTFLMTLGVKNHSFTVSNLAPGERRRLVQKNLELGYIWPGEALGRGSARIYWDRVKFERSRGKPPLTALPPNARTYIEDCPRANPASDPDEYSRDNGRAAPSAWATVPARIKLFTF
jgi:hypothetical protein